MRKRCWKCCFIFLFSLVFILNGCKHGSSDEKEETADFTDQEFTEDFYSPETEPSDGIEQESTDTEIEVDSGTPDSENTSPFASYFQISEDSHYTRVVYDIVEEADVADEECTKIDLNIAEVSDFSLSDYTSNDFLKIRVTGTPSTDADIQLLGLELRHTDAVIELLDLSAMEGNTHVSLSSNFSSIAVKNIKLPAELTKIDDNAFSGCSRLKTVEMGTKILSIGKNAFSGCVSIKTLEIPNSVKSIAQTAFDGCYSLEAISIPDSVQGVCPAFTDCVSLKSVHLGAGIYALSMIATGYGSGYYTGQFYGWYFKSFPSSDELTEISVSEDNAVFTIKDGVLYTKDLKTLIFCPKKLATQNVIIPSGVERIETAAFAQCDIDIYMVYIPATVKNIQPRAFFATGISEAVFEDTSGWIRRIEGQPYSSVYYEYEGESPFGGNSATNANNLKDSSGLGTYYKDSYSTRFILGYEFCKE